MILIWCNHLFEAFVSELEAIGFPLVIWVPYALIIVKEAMLFFIKLKNGYALIDLKIEKIAE